MKVTRLLPCKPVYIGEANNAGELVAALKAAAAVRRVCRAKSTGGRRV